MTLFLRNKKNETICSCDFFTDDDGCLDVSCSISVINYTKLLMEFPKDPKTVGMIASTFDDLDEMRGFLWECHTKVMGKDGDKDAAYRLVKAQYDAVAKAFGLSVVED